MAEKLVTISAVTFNCLEYTKLFLKYLQLYADIPYRLIIVDNHSTDGTPEFLQQQNNIEFILNKKNFGFGFAHDQAFARTNTKYYLGLNNDTVIFPMFLSRLIEIAENNQEYGEWGVSSNCIGARDPRTDIDINTEIQKMVGNGTNPETIIRHYYNNPSDFMKLFAEKNPGLSELEVPPHFTGGWCFLVRTDAVKKAGGLFDKRFHIGFYEDSDLSWRIKKTGYKIAHINKLYIHHFDHASFRGNKLRKKPQTIARENAKKFAFKWSDTIREYLRSQFDKGMTLDYLVKNIHLIGNFIGRNREDYDNFEKILKEKFINDLNMNFLDFLMKYRY